MKDRPTVPSLDEALLDEDYRAALEAELGPELYEELRTLRSAIAARERSEIFETARAPVFILPGILGSELWRPAFPLGDHLWLDLDDLAWGGVRKLATVGDDGTIYADGVLDFAYARMKYRLRYRGHDAEYLPYDWRWSPHDTGQAVLAGLKERGVTGATLVAHSMGGLVARRIAKLDPEQQVVAKVITVGTPNHGSYSPVQVFRLTHSTLLKLGRIDVRHTPSEIVRDVLRHMPGLVEMMPSPTLRTFDFFNRSAWPSGGQAPLQRTLDEARARKEALADVDGRFVQIIGVGVPTIRDSRVEGGKFVYSTDMDGDGTVPRDLAETGGEAVERYFVEGEHGWLCHNLAVIRAVDAILSGEAVALEKDSRFLLRAEAATPQVSDDDLRREAEEKAAAMPAVPRKADLLDDFVSRGFDPDPALPEIAAAIAGPAEPGISFTPPGTAAGIEGVFAAQGTVGEPLTEATGVSDSVPFDHARAAHDAARNSGEMPTSADRLYRIVRTAADTAQGIERAERERRISLIPSWPSLGATSTR